MLDLLTFTGIDRKTNRWFEVLEEYQRVEFGVLVGSNTGWERPIFPPLTIINALRSISHRFNTAIHLCGSYTRGLMAGGKGLEEALRISEGFSRVQINLPPHFTTENLDVACSMIPRFIDASEAQTVILQHRSGWDKIPLIHPRLEYLFDQSGGSGKVNFESWPIPPVLGRWGYAGGIGPGNIGEAMRFNRRHEDRSLWFDMESQVRTAGWLDINKVLQVCQIAFRGPGPRAKG